MLDMTVELRIGGRLMATVKPRDTHAGLSLREYPGDAAMKDVLGIDAFETISREIEAALSGAGPALVIDVLMYGKVGSGARVFPSQEFVRRDEAEKLKRANGGHDVGKVLASSMVSHNGWTVRQAVMHTQKIGNAIRWIDEWHGDDAHGAVPVDPYAALTLEATTLRGKEGKNNFYAYLKKPEAIIEPLNNGAALDARTFGPTHFFMAMLIRGGVFGSKSEES
jgi:CRISPR-associated protein Csy3